MDEARAVGKVMVCATSGSAPMSLRSLVAVAARQWAAGLRRLPSPRGRTQCLAGPPLSAIYENGFSVKAHLLIPAQPVDGAAGPVSPSLLAMVAGVARRSRGPSQDSTIHLSAHV